MSSNKRRDKRTLPQPERRQMASHPRPSQRPRLHQARSQRSIGRSFERPRSRRLFEPRSTQSGARSAVALGRHACRL